MKLNSEKGNKERDWWRRIEIDRDGWRLKEIVGEELRLMGIDSD